MFLKTIKHNDTDEGRQGYGSLHITVGQGLPTAMSGVYSFSRNWSSTNQ